MKVKGEKMDHDFEININDDRLEREFEKQYRKESVCKITLREISKRINDLIILKSRRLRERD